MLRRAASAAVGFGVAAGCSFGLSSIVSAEERPTHRRTKMLQGVVIGGGCAGALMAQSVEHLMDLTLVDRKTYFEFTPALKDYLLGWGNAAGQGEMADEEKNWFRKYFIDHRYYLRRTNCVVGDVAEVTDREVVMQSGTRLPFDVCFVCTGSRSAAPWRGSRAVSVQERAKEMAAYAKLVSSCKSILIIGGGPCAVENAAVLAEHHPGSKVTIMHSKQRLIPAHGHKVGKYAERHLRRSGVEMQFLRRVTAVKYDQTAKKFTVNYRFTDPEGKPLSTDAAMEEVSEPVDYVLDCRGILPNTSVLKKNFARNLDADGFVHVNAFGQLKGHPNIFALGDIARHEGTHGNASGLPYIVDEVTAAASLFRMSAARRVPKGGNNLFEYGFPLQLVRLSDYDYTGTVQLVGEVRSLMAFYSARKMTDSFMSSITDPSFKSAIDTDANGHMTAWFNNAMETGLCQDEVKA
ncbi:Apoptosis-inducing factor-like protein B [Diplonema papillatum]|nr:Apoptosis-inducing factor-like protein B [Diplonema papillatum]